MYDYGRNGRYGMFEGSGDEEPDVTGMLDDEEPGIPEVPVSRGRGMQELIWNNKTECSRKLGCVVRTVGWLALVSAAAAFASAGLIDRVLCAALLGWTAFDSAVSAFTDDYAEIGLRAFVNMGLVFMTLLALVFTAKSIAVGVSSSRTVEMLGRYSVWAAVSRAGADAVFATVDYAGHRVRDRSDW